MDLVSTPEFGMYLNKNVVWDFGIKKRKNIFSYNGLKSQPAKSLPLS